MNRFNLLASTTDKNRRMVDRREYSRRIIKYAFGSDKWVEAIQSSYVFWPKEDRRMEERRSVTRRMVERRIQIRKYRRHALHGLTFRRHRQSQMLTDEERKMLNDLSRRF